MTLSTQPVHRQQIPPKAKPVFGTALKAGLTGGTVIGFLLILRQISSPFLQNVLIPPVIVIVWVVTGIGAAMMAGNRVISSKQGGRIGVIAGLISGIVGGIASMIIAAFGATFSGYGEGILSQFSNTQLSALIEAGFTEQMIATSGSILSAMFVCGGGGMIVSALLGGLGGWLYPKFGD